MPPDPAATGASELVAAYLANAMAEHGEIPPEQRAIAEAMLRRGFVEGVRWHKSFAAEQSA